MTDDMHELPVAAVHGGVEIYGLQSPERIAEAKRQIAEVIRMRAGDRLCAFACDATNAPEARLLAKHKALASLEQRQRRIFDVERLEAATIGIERRTTVMGRLIGWRDAGWWPEAWRPRG
jgi:hypothetical protein